MDPKEFKQRLEELAELQLIKVASPAKRKAEDVVTVWRNGEQIEIADNENPTLYYKIKKLKNETAKCEDCNKKVKNRIITKRLLTFPVLHWRQMCNSCNMYQHPVSKNYTLVGVSTQNVWNTWLRNNHPDLQQAEQTGLNQPELEPVEKKPAK